MAILSAAATLLLAALHVYILVLEMFLWTTPRGRRAFGLKPDFAQQTRVLAGNQGLYNGILAAGLVWGVLHPTREFGMQLRLFFAGAVVVAGGYGGATAARKIWVVQMLPGIVCCILTLAEA